MVNDSSSAAQAATQTEEAAALWAREAEAGDTNKHICCDLTISLAILLAGWSGLEAKVSIKEINKLLQTKWETAQSDHKWRVNGLCS